jgi:CRISPR-associated protein Cmr2
LPYHSGRLICYSTFFNSIDVEFINPHSRKTRAGAGPIYLECVPTGAKGTFTLLYIPFDLIAQPGEEEIKRGAKANLQIVAEAIKALMLIYGFSAKRTSGFGAAEDSIDGMVQTRGESYEVSRLSTIAKELERVRF